jgi:hypothetical protein
MILLWLVTGVSLAVAVLALRRARHATARLEQLSQLCWELKYQQGEMRQQLMPRADGGIDVAPIMPAGPKSGFVSLKSLKR